MNLNKNLSTLAYIVSCVFIVVLNPIHNEPSRLVGHSFQPMINREHRSITLCLFCSLPLQRPLTLRNVPSGCPPTMTAPPSLSWKHPFFQSQLGSVFQHLSPQSILQSSFQPVFHKRLKGVEGLCWLLAALQVIIVSRFRRDIPLSNSRNVSLYGEEMNLDVSLRAQARVCGRWNRPWL